MTTREEAVAASQVVNDYFVLSTDPNVPPIPELALWEQKMLTRGQQFGQALLNLQTTNPQAPWRYFWNGVLYDASHTYFRIANYTGDAKFDEYAKAALWFYRDRYIFNSGRPVGQTTGYEKHTRGIAYDFLLNENPVSKEAVLGVAARGVFGGLGEYDGALDSPQRSRPAAYSLCAYVDARRCGSEEEYPRMGALVDVILHKHFDRWINDESEDGGPFNYRLVPFMIGLEMDALTYYAEHIDNDAQILPAIEEMLEVLWTRCWRESNESFIYEDLNDLSGAPVLSFLICHAFAWAWRKTGKCIYLERGDRAFASAVRQTGAGQSKQFTQMFMLSFDYVATRS